MIENYLREIIRIKESQIQIWSNLAIVGWTALAWLIYVMVWQMVHR